jgi:hypothetical protein
MKIVTAYGKHIGNFVEHVNDLAIVHGLNYTDAWGCSQHVTCLDYVFAYRNLHPIVELFRGKREFRPKSPLFPPPN